MKKSVVTPKMAGIESIANVTSTASTTTRTARKNMTQGRTRIRALVVLAAYVRPVATRYRLCTMWTRFAIVAARRICGITWKVEGWENLPDGPAILLPKHQSTWETFWLPSFVPRQLTFVYKRELHMVPFFGWAMASLHMINIDRSRGQDAFEQVVRQGAEHLNDGWWIVIFPEGTRSNKGEPQPFKSGLFHLAEKFPGVQLVPVWIDNVQRVMPKGEVVPVPILCTATFGAPMQLEPDEDKQSFLERARAAVISLRPAAA